MFPWQPHVHSPSDAPTIRETPSRENLNIFSQVTSRWYFSKVIEMGVPTHQLIPERAKKHQGLHSRTGTRQFPNLVSGPTSVTGTIRRTQDFEFEANCPEPADQAITSPASVPQTSKNDEKNLLVISVIAGVQKHLAGAKAGGKRLTTMTGASGVDLKPTSNERHFKFLTQPCIVCCPVYPFQQKCRVLHPRVWDFNIFQPAVGSKFEPTCMP